MHTQSIPVNEYEKLVAQFNPTKFNADEWVSIAADAGQKYIVFTSRHHDGFSMYDTALSDYKVTNSPFGRDPARELADACARRGDIKLGFYSSLLDWHHPAYRFREGSGLVWGNYLDFLHGQVRELCTHYGELACLWFDGDWPHGVFDASNSYFRAGGSFEYEKMYNMIHTLQPDAVILNNHHSSPIPGEDVQGFEQDLPGLNTAGFNATLPTAGKPLEVCMTINDHWGFNATDQNQKSAASLVHYLVRSASAGANFLLNVGPKPDGEIPAIQAERLRKVGVWLKTNGSAVYGTQSGVLPSTSITVSTRKDETHFLHVLDYVSDCVTLSGVPAHVQQAYLLSDGQPIGIDTSDDKRVLLIPEERHDPLNTVVVLT